MKRVLIICAYDIFHKNGSSHNILENYLKGFISNDYNISYITRSKGYGTKEKLMDLYGNTINIKRYLLIAFFFSLMKKAKSVLNFFNKKENSHKDYKNKWSDSNFNKKEYIFYILFKIRSIITLIFLKMKNDNYDFIYGIEPEGSLIADMFGKFLKIPSFARLMGTSANFILFELNNDLRIFKRNFPTIYRSVHKCCDFTIMTNDGTEGDKILEYFGRNKENYLFIVNGVTRHKEIPNTVKTKDKKTFVTVSRLVSWKRVDRFILLASKLRDKGSFEFKIIGDGTEEKKLKKLVKRYNIDQLVNFMGRLDHEKVIKIISKADFTVSLYDYSNFTNQVLESLYYNTPVISFLEKSTEPILQDKINSILIGKEFSNFDIQKIMSYINEPKRYQDLIDKMKIKNNTILDWDKRMNTEINWIEKKLAKYYKSN